MVSLWFLVELIEIYQMTYSYMGVIELFYTRKLLVYTFDGHSLWARGATPDSFVYTEYILYIRRIPYIPYIRSRAYTLRVRYATQHTLYTPLSRLLVCNYCAIWNLNGC